MKLSKIRLGLVLLLGIFLSAGILPNANADYYTFETNGDGNTWAWRISDDGGINEVTLYKGIGDGRDEINGDAYDSSYGRFYYGDTEDQVTVDLNDDERSDGSYSFSEGDVTATVTIQGNKVTRIITSTVSQKLYIGGNNLGSDGSTKFITLGEKVISFEDAGENNGPYENSDPIFVYEYTGVLRDNAGGALNTSGDDSQEVFLTGTSLRLVQRLYGVINDGSMTEEDFFKLFVQWVDENPDRMDFFETSWTPSNVLITLRKSSNLSFSQSMYGSDKLADPTGELRRLVDFINSRYGN